jgi:hypothetical protein
MPMIMRYPNLVSLGSVKLTDESRRPLTEERDERSVVVTLASGKKKKFVQGVWRRWDIEWENVSSDASLTVDGFGGRDEIRSLAEGAGWVTFELDDGRNAKETYTVQVETYNEEVLSRRGPEGFRYRVSLSLSEQGGEA